MNNTDQNCDGSYSNETSLYDISAINLSADLGSLTEKSEHDTTNSKPILRKENVTADDVFLDKEIDIDTLIQKGNEISVDNSSIDMSHDLLSEDDKNTTNLQIDQIGKLRRRTER